MRDDQKVQRFLRIFRKHANLQITTLFGNSWNLLHYLQKVQVPRYIVCSLGTYTLLIFPCELQTFLLTCTLGIGFITGSTNCEFCN